MIIRLQSPDGQRRIECESGDTADILLAKTRIAFNYLDCDVFTTRDHKDRLCASSRTLTQLGLKHGDMMYVKPNEMEVDSKDNTKQNGSSRPSTSAGLPGPSSSSTVDKTVTKVIEDRVDEVLRKMDGRIERKKQPLCRHNDTSKCAHCFSLEPFDETYQKEHKIKHLSFHAYLRKLSSGVDKGKFINLENISCKIKPGCTAHPPYPKGICSKCAPSAVTLNQQPYRHVDCIMFEETSMLDRFLDYWRHLVVQRMAILYGRYETYNEVPLGIKAVVCAVYEPPQESKRDSVTLLNDPFEEKMDTMALKLGLRRVGWMFTDLLPMEGGKVRYLRNVEWSYLLSAQECITAAWLQNKYPNPCKLTTDGVFGSKFVTVCVTGDAENNIHLEGYQVSNQCMTLVKDNCLLPTKDAPELAYVKESTSAQFVPDVHFKTKDSYGNEVTKVARPLPVEYLLLDVPASTPKTKQETMFRNCEPFFPIENRITPIQDMEALRTYLNYFKSSKDLLGAAKDFHFLHYLLTMDFVELPLDGLLEAVKNNDAVAAISWAEATPEWKTLETIVETIAAPGVVADLDAAMMDVTWACSQCTFENPADKNSCDMCDTPRH